jgi:hypothetical protein
MQELKDAVERMEPRPEASGDWDAVLQAAGARRRSRLIRPLAALAVAAAALFGLTLLQPWESESPTFLERALAAVDDGPVLHVVLRGEWGGTLVNLDSGDRSPVYGENEIWYDFARNRMHTISRLGGVIEDEAVYEPREPAADLKALGRHYREALEQGTARVVGEGVVAGETVVWIVVRSENLPDVSDGKVHGWAEEVAVSRETFKPVALRQTRDGEPGPGTLQRVLELELLPAGDGDFTSSRRSSYEGLSFSYQPLSGELTAAQAEKVLGRPPLWSGRRIGDLELARIGLTETRTYRPRVTQEGGVIRVTGPRQEVGSARGIVLFYGTIGDSPDTYRDDPGPRWDEPHVAIRESLDGPIGVGGTGSRYVPPEGSILIQAGGRTGLLSVDGLYVSIQAPSDELVLSAARALEPMPR